MTCAPMSDHSFGPRVHPGCRSFDFTILFEDIVFGCLPAAVFLPLSLAYIGFLSQKPVTYSCRSKLLSCRLITLTALFTVQLAFLAIRVREPPVSTDASLAADILGLFSALTACVLSFLTHQRSRRPSTTLNLYLSTSILLGVARSRTLWLLPPSSGGLGAAVAMTIILALSLAAVALESVEKKTVDQKHVAPEQHSGFWSRTSFAWLASTFREGYSKVISLHDLPPLDTGLSSYKMCQKLTATWGRYDQRARYSLLRACFHSYLGSLVLPVIPRLCLTTFTFAQPFLISATLTYVDDPNPNTNYGKGLIGAWVLTYLGLAVSNSVYQYQRTRYVTRLRGGLNALIYHRLLQTRTADLGNITAVTLMGTDVERIVNGLQSIHETWASLLEIGVACWLLERQLSLACIAPIVLVIAFIAFSSRLSSSFSAAQRRWIEKVQARLRVTSAMLGDIKAIKMLGLSRSMVPVIQRLRVDEITTSQSYRKLLVAMLLLALTPINLAPVVTFAIYVVIAVFWKNETLLTVQAFTSIALISLLTTPVIVFIQGLPSVVQCVGNFDRLQEYCNCGSGEPDTSGNGDVLAVPEEGFVLESLSPESRTTHVFPQHPEVEVVRLNAQDFAWNKASPSPAIKQATVSIKRGTVTAIIGPVGSGKSSFMNALLGELAAVHRGTFENNETRQENNWPGIKQHVAYCAQTPWVENGSIRQNIIGAATWDGKWYSTVLAACCLDTDLEQLRRGDQTRVGSKGVNLSGGQKQRIALARAVYAKQSIVLLDDVFSGMDAHTAENVFNQLFGVGRGLLRNHHTTVVLATHNYRMVSQADSIVVLEDGKIVDSGSPAALLHKEGGYANKLALSVSESSSKGLIAMEEEMGEKNDGHGSDSDLTIPARQLPDANDAQDDTEFLRDTRRKNGELSVYTYYLASSGYAATTFYAVSMALWIFCTEFSTIWVRLWSEANTTSPNHRVGMYMGVYAMLGVMGTVAACLAAWFAIMTIISNSASKLHFDLLNATLRAPFRFFTGRDNGELLNRFSEDMELIDMDLPSTALNYTSTAFACLVQLLILAIFSRSLAAALPVLLVVLYFLQRFYLQTSRQLRLLMIEAKAPLYTHFSEAEASSGAGAVTIRAFGWQRAYAARACDIIDRAQRPAYLQACAQHWLAFVLTLALGAMAAVIVATVVAVGAAGERRLDVRSGDVGVALVMLLGLGETLSRLIQTWTKLESSVGAVARVKRFVAETEAEDAEPQGHAADGGADDDVGSSGVQAGGRGALVEFDGVVASYNPGAEPVLKGICLSAQPGKHIAICGRSGSGKTSLVLCLLRMLHISEGRITLDGVTLSSGDSSAAHMLSVEAVRSRFNVVPQDPFLLPGTTVRFNVDPSSEAVGDEDIVSALQRVGLWDLIRDQGGLDCDVDGLALSAGQRQLLCVARALVRKKQRNVLILDEATSSLDHEAEAVVQDIVASDFRDCTVLAVMHRLTHVTAYDQIALMDAGSLVEFGEAAEMISGATRIAKLYRAQMKE